MAAGDLGALTGPPDALIALTAAVVPDGSVVDASAADPRLARALAARGCTVLSVHLDQRRLEQGAPDPSAQVRVVHDSAGLRTRQAAAVVAVEPTEPLAELARAVAPGGRLAVLTGGDPGPLPAGLEPVTRNAVDGWTLLVARVATGPDATDDPRDPAPAPPPGAGARLLRIDLDRTAALLGAERARSSRLEANLQRSRQETRRVLDRLAALESARSVRLMRGVRRRLGRPGPAPLPPPEGDLLDRPDPTTPAGPWDGSTEPAATAPVGAVTGGEPGVASGWTVGLAGGTGAAPWSREALLSAALAAAGAQVHLLGGSPVAQAEALERLAAAGEPHHLMLLVTRPSADAVRLADAAVAAGWVLVVDLPALSPDGPADGWLVSGIERHLVSRADLVTAGSSIRLRLVADVPTLARPLLLPAAPAAAVPTARGRVATAGGRPPVVGVLGACGPGFDAELLGWLARACPGWVFEVPGADPAAPRAPEVRVVPPLATDPAVIAGWSAAVLLVTPGLAAETADPAELATVLAAGVPLVLPFLTDWLGRSGVRITEAPREMADAVAELVADPGSAGPAGWPDGAHWTDRVGELLAAVPEPRGDRAARLRELP